MMATRIQITIPDELAQRLEPWRDRMNISKVCAEAIQSEITTLEASLTPEIEGLAEIIARLREHKASLEQSDYATGLADGDSFARKRAGYDDFIRYGVIAESIELDQVELPDDVEALLEAAIREGEVTDRWSYTAGWLDGLQKIWDAIKDKV